MSNEEQKLETLPTGEIAIHVSAHTMLSQLRAFIDNVGSILDDGRYARGQRKKKPRGAKSKQFSRMCWEAYHDVMRTQRRHMNANLDEIRRRTSNG